MMPLPIIGPAAVRTIAVAAAVVAVALLVWWILGSQREAGRAALIIEQQENDRDAVQQGREGRDDALDVFDAGRVPDGTFRD